MATRKAGTKSKAQEAQVGRIEIPSAHVCRLRVRIRGLTPLMQNRWRQTVIDDMRDKQEGRAKKTKEARDPQKEVQEILAAATIPGRKGKERQYGHPALAIVEAMAAAGHRAGDDWTNKGPTIKGAVTIHGGDLIPIMGPGPIIDTRPGRIKGTWTIAHRPLYNEWASEFVAEFDLGIFSLETFIHLLMMAGRNVGIGSYRVERGGQYGRFEVEGAEVLEVL